MLHLRAPFAPPAMIACCSASALTGCPLALTAETLGRSMTGTGCRCAWTAEAPTSAATATSVRMMLLACISRSSSCRRARSELLQLHADGVDQLADPLVVAGVDHRGAVLNRVVHVHAVGVLHGEGSGPGNDVDHDDVLVADPVRRAQRFSVGPRDHFPFHGGAGVDRGL